MPASIGVNLRVTGHCRQGGRKYMEDFFSVAYQQTEDEKDLEYAFFGIYDGHGGAEAAAFAKEHLMEAIIKRKNFWSDCDEEVLRAIKDGYIATHYAMWREQEKWPRTASGLPSTAGTTASVAFIRRGKIYIGHVGDSGIILGYQEPGSSEWKARPLTRDHKPENADEMSRIEQCGGKVVAKSGVPRVVWNRPKIGHQGPVRRSTPIDEIPFLAVARSLGDLWSYNSQINQFIVSPDPDCSVLKIDTNMHRCLIFGTDGLYNMLSPMMAVHIVQQAERHNENAALSDSTYKTWLNPSKLLVERALERWHATKMRADNTSVVTLMLDPPGPPRAQVLKDRKKNLPERGLRIMTRFDGNNAQDGNCNNCDTARLDDTSENPAQTLLENVPDPIPAAPLPEEHPKNNNNHTSSNKEDDKRECSSSTPENTPVSSSDLTSNFPLKERNFLPKTRESTSFDPREPLARPTNSPDNGKENLKASRGIDDNIQCNEISSSNMEVDSTCDDEGPVDSTNKSGKHNLRSTKKNRADAPIKPSADETGDNLKVAKRKCDVESSPQPRKSVRIDHIQKKCVEATEKHKKSPVLPEKVKKLPERSDLAPVSGTKLSIAQKILKSKNINLKKKKQTIIKKQITKKKIRMVLETVRKSALPGKSVVTSSKKKEPLVISKGFKKSSQETKLAKAKSKVVVTKAKSKLQRLADKNASQRQRNVKSAVKSDSQTKEQLQKQPGDKKGGVNKEKDVEKLKKRLVIKTNVEPKNSSPPKVDASSSNVLAGGGDSRRSLRSSIAAPEVESEVAADASSKTPPSVSLKPKIKAPVKAKTLRKRIQHKTASLRKNVMRSTLK